MTNNADALSMTSGFKLVTIHFYIMYFEGILGSGDLHCQ